MAGDANTIIKVGPGGWSVRRNSKWDLKGVSKITRILISLGEDDISSYIYSLQFEYIEDGKTKLSPVFGNDSDETGFYFELVAFNNEKHEYITRLSGAALFGEKKRNRVTCLTFETNLKKYGPFGSVPKGADNFNFGFGPDNHFAGFFGTCSSEDISSIGCYISLN